MAHFLNLIRYKNLLMLALVQVVIKYALFIPFQIDTSLAPFEFYLLLIATICIAAAGNIINDIQDVAIDRINKPEKVLIGKKITEKTGYNYYLILNVIGVGIGFYLANSIGKPSFAALFIVFSALLYLYATYVKSIAIVGNLLVSFLVAMSIVVVGLFDLFPAITDTNRESLSNIFTILLAYAFFAFLMTFIREIVKDMEDIDGDKNGGYQTLPILLGRKRTSKVVFFLTISSIVVLFFYMYTTLYREQLLLLYFLIFIVGPLIYVSIKVYAAEKKSEFKQLSAWLKLIMVFGIISLTLYPFLIK
ncbi:MAG: prenyltransferase [Flavobacteriaceae bacterium CG_4_8_14_3_um_filter_34_10]|nr:UbiA family prenyltransferase [Flavobacteriia bacterium]PIQ17716.1 MAG: prenyltransferase [Flavobacteriaceae bacterium CG18_big_fil_WC_8_21_14_2_50_34_36]PIV50326.1 MAG: prenyltransferase [Flavobacteriaceae bacterium CG02_land_8_20_14_3_00_34_13]PIX09532.1 MAG: prenyltransferase [Flavobacteriaceae bacterium CG_4_8_14_3_um_filter_34_10]PIZ08542.1 MAG: prenyltransferase [Flavobacteriaceae bacterium CG_4_10_14_0_8_um_filter_34_31]PJC08559.1 MAG: prenyltransferase [Flavobacteriaceae bacterium C